MKWLASRLFWGLILIGGGLLLLLSNLGIIEITAPIWSLVFLVASIGFLSVFISERENWWALIPGMVLLALAAITYLNFAYPEIRGELTGVIILGSIGLSFIFVYLVNRENWWAIIPAGVMLTIAAVAGLSNIISGFDTGGIFFLGLGLTFLIVAVLPSHRGELRWAFIPGGILTMMGLLILVALGQWINIIGPSVLIIFGVFLIYRSFLKRS
ncbi:MAG: LiaF transmembrane domain-containing protein [Anaerolineales bacterium]